MRIITRYIFVELLKVFSVSLFGLTLLMLLLGVVREAMQQSLPLGQLLQLIPFILPDALRISVPVTLLLATTSLYGRMSGSNEIIAAKSLGISPWSLLAPTYTVAFLLSLLTVWLNDLAVSWGREGAQRVVVNAVEEIAYSMLRTQRTYSTPAFSISVKEVRDRTLLLPTVVMAGQKGAPSVTISADEAELHAERQRGVLKAVLRHGTFVAGSVKYHFDVEEREIPLVDATRGKGQTRSASWVPLREIDEQKLQQRQTIAKLELDLAARAAVQMLCGEFDELASRGWRDRLEGLASERKQVYRLQTEPHRRWSAGFACLCFAWVGAPMAIRLRNRDFLTSFFLCFLPILIVYYPLLEYGVNGAKSGAMPPYTVWLGNLLLLAWGGWLLRRVMRY